MQRSWRGAGCEKQLAMEKPRILIPALGGALTAGGCALLLVAFIDSYHAGLWPESFAGKTLLPNAAGLIIVLSLFFGFPAGLVISFIASRVFSFDSCLWEAPIAAFIGAASGILAVYLPAFGNWGTKLVLGDFFILVAGLSVAAGGATCALLLASSCRALRSKLA